MTRKRLGGENPQMGSVSTQQAYARLAWFLSGAYPGASKRKRIARDFGVSPDTAKGWLCGQAWPRHATFLAMLARWPGFIEFVLGTGPAPFEMVSQARAAEDRGAEMVRARLDEDARGAFVVAKTSVGGPRPCSDRRREGPCVGGPHEAPADPVGQSRRRA